MFLKWEKARKRRAREREREREQRERERESKYTNMANLNELTDDEG